MPIDGKYTLHLPPQNFATLIFGSPSVPLSTTQRCFSDATKPETHYLTRHTFRVYAKRFAAGLQRAGLKRGDRVLVFSPNQLFYPVAFMGVVMSGGAFSGANPTYVARELAHQIQDSGASFLLCKRGDPLATGIEAAAMAGLDKRNIYVFDDGIYESLDQPGSHGCKYWSALMVSEAEAEKFAWDPLSTREEAEQTLALNYSSGTTGLSKGVEITHNNYVANTAQYNFNIDLDPAAVSRKHLERWLDFLPMYHAMAQMIFVGCAQLRQTPVYIMERFDFITVLKNIEKFQISDLILVPPVMVMLAKSPETKKYDLSSVWRVGSGAAPLSREVSEEVENLWPKGRINVKQGWGMTETTCSGMGWDPRILSTSASTGWPNPNTRCKIMSLPSETDPTLPRRELPANQEGELWCSGPQIMKGYWRNPTATAETIETDSEGRWLKTGDIAYFDEEEKFFVTGRLKELIKVKGMQVAPAELDGVCLEESGVADAGVVGVTINHEEHPRVYIVLQAGVPATPETAKKIAEGVNKKVTRHKRITGGVVFVDALPKNPSGKILRRLLRERAQKEVKEERAKGGARL